MSWLEKELEKAYEIKTQKIGMAEGYKAEGKVLNRVSRRTSDGWEIEDSCHAELVVNNWASRMTMESERLDSQEQMRTTTSKMSH